MGLMQTFVGTTVTLADVRFDVDIELTSNLTLVFLFELIESALETNSCSGIESSLLNLVRVAQGFVFYSSILKGFPKVGLAHISNMKKDKQIRSKKTNHQMVLLQTTKIQKL